MTNVEIKSVLDDHKLWLNREGGQRANLHDADLSGAKLRGANLYVADLHDADLHNADLRGANLYDADLYGADLHDADLSGAKLRGAELRGANLYGADLYGADLHDADLRGANLRGADLRGANLRGANLHDADLRGAVLDFSVWPFWCGSLSVKIDVRNAAQLVYHAVRACQSVTDDDGVVAFCKSPDVIALANRFHRVDECGRIGEVAKTMMESEVAK